MREGKLPHVLDWHQCLEAQHTEGRVPVRRVAYNNYLSNLGHAAKSAQTVRGYGLTHQV